MKMPGRAAFSAVVDPTVSESPIAVTDQPEVPASGAGAVGGDVRIGAVFPDPLGRPALAALAAGPAPLDGSSNAPTTITAAVAMISASRPLTWRQTINRVRIWPYSSAYCSTTAPPSGGSRRLIRTRRAASGAKVTISYKT